MKSPPLTVIERDILKALANGLQSKEIADMIQRSTATVEHYIRDLFNKFQVQTRPQLVAHAFVYDILKKNDVAVWQGSLYEPSGSTLVFAG